ncbi:MAG: hypothetical protein O3C40_35150 [Planctomycetota bacterium]|nr:hypothetical protein [Planctomycetota bacterium]
MSANTLLEELKMLKPASANEAALLRAVSFLLEREGKQASTTKAGVPLRDAMEDRD